MTLALGCAALGRGSPPRVRLRLVIASFCPHVHWDHIQGLPFFEPAYVEGTHIDIYALRAAADELRSVIGGITRHEFFPTPLESVPANFEFHEVKPGSEFSITDFAVTPFALNHPFGAVGYRVDCDGTSVAYVSDTAPFDLMLHKQHFVAGPEEPSEVDRQALSDMRSALRDTLRGVDTVIYDTHFLPDEYERFPHWGHSTPDQALQLCHGIDIRRLVLYHHAPSHTDDMMDEVSERYARLGRSQGIEVIAARESMRLTMGEGAP